jgi:hypothetical protein
MTTMTKTLSETTRRSPRRLGASCTARTGHSHGGITRLMSPGDLGELVKPFVFLDPSSSRTSMAPGSRCIRTPASRRTRPCSRGR